MKDHIQYTIRVDNRKVEKIHHHILNIVLFLENPCQFQPNFAQSVLLIEKIQFVKASLLWEIYILISKTYDFRKKKPKCCYNVTFA